MPLIQPLFSWVSVDTIVPLHIFSVLLCLVYEVLYLVCEVISGMDLSLQELNRKLL